MPLGELPLSAAQAALAQFEQDLKQAKAFHAAGQSVIKTPPYLQHSESIPPPNPNAIDSIVIDGGSLLVDIITMVKLDEAKNPNKTYRYAERNAYIKNLFNDLNESGLNVIWTSKARPVWVAEKKIPNLYSPDCHDDIPFMVDLNVQFVTEPSPEGLKFYGVIGTNAYNPGLVGKSISNLKWDLLMNLLGRSEVTS